jgi:hypothetical protein
MSGTALDRNAIIIGLRDLVAELRNSGEVVRIVAWCWNGPIPGDKWYGGWSTISAGGGTTLRFTSNGWCGGTFQIWRVDPEIR